mmetsp:Transcript_14909/g.18733  ORF Transcript_14909/g.18733 Transcript_14909/m.18733 type:complete len:321 (-) Transcript_14909:61-1023(-)
MGDVAMAEHVGEAVVTQCVDVDVEPAGLVGEGRVADECRRSLGRHDVQHIEVLSDSLIVGHILEGSDTVVLVDSDEVVVEELIDTFAIALLGQSLAEIIIGRENDGRSTVVLHVGVVANAFLSEGRLAQIQDLLGCTTALDWELGAGEDSVATAEVVAKHRSLVGALKVVHATDGGIDVVKRLLGTFDQIVSELEPRVDDEDVVGGGGTIRECDRVVIRVEARDGRLVPFDARSVLKKLLVGANDVVFLVLSLGRLRVAKDATGDHRVSRLVVVECFGVVDGDVAGSNLARSGELGDEGLATAAGTDDSDARVLRLLGCG